MIHLDTNVLILAADATHRVRDDLRRWQREKQQMAVCAMAWAEFRCGPVSAELIRGWERLLGQHIVPVDRTTANLAAMLFNTTGRRSRSLPDCLIAATAILAGAQLATFNQQDFEPFLPHGLKLATL